MYVEMGTGPVGEANHAGISPNVNPMYTQPYVLRTSKNGKKYRVKGWYYFNEKSGSVRYTEGQPARPFMYPAAVETQAEVEAAIQNEILKGVTG